MGGDEFDTSICIFCGELLLVKNIGALHKIIVQAMILSSRNAITTENSQNWGFNSITRFGGWQRRSDMGGLTWAYASEGDYSYYKYIPLCSFAMGMSMNNSLSELWMSYIPEWSIGCTYATHAVYIVRPLQYDSLFLITSQPWKACGREVIIITGYLTWLLFLPFTLYGIM